MVTIIGLGPGAKEYILPVAVTRIKASMMVIGARRNLDSIEEHTDLTMDYSQGFEAIATYLKAHKKQAVSVVVSGDTGFHSMLIFVKRHIEDDYITTIPGISSLQYMYARIKCSYEKSQWLSIHGRSLDLSPYIKERKEIALLTDQTNGTSYIGELLIKHKVTNCFVYVGERLSYNDEKISRLSPEECVTYQADPLSVVVIRYG